MPAEVAHFKNDPVGRMRTLAKEPGRENVEVVSADLVAMPEAPQPADVLWLHLFYHDLHTALICSNRSLEFQKREGTGAPGKRKCTTNSDVHLPTFVIPAAGAVSPL